jgi:hypothetical protein
MSGVADRRSRHLKQQRALAAVERRAGHFGCLLDGAYSAWLQPGAPTARAQQEMDAAATSLLAPGAPPLGSPRVGRRNYAANQRARTSAAVGAVTRASRSMPDGVVAVAQAVAWLCDMTVEGALGRLVLPPAFPTGPDEYPLFRGVGAWRGEPALAPVAPGPVAPEPGPECEDGEASD